MVAKANLFLASMPPTKVGGYYRKTSFVDCGESSHKRVVAKANLVLICILPAEVGVTHVKVETTRSIPLLR